jgi:hypothetical protein
MCSRTNISCCGHMIKPHDGRESTPQFTWLARVLKNASQPVAILLDMIDLVMSHLMLHPEQSIGRQTSSTIATLEEMSLPAKEPGFIIEPNGDWLPPDRDHFNWSEFISNVTQNISNRNTQKYQTETQPLKCEESRHRVLNRGLTT